MSSTLLLADANTAVQRIVAMTFAGEDVTVVSVGDGEQAIARIAAEPPDIVLADVTLPGRDGYEVAAFVKGRPDLAHIPALLLAGALDPVDADRAADARCDGVIAKPFEPQQVVARVRELLGGATGSPTQTVPGVPRPIERLIDPRSAGSSVPQFDEETPLRIVKPSTTEPVVAATPDGEEEPTWPEPAAWPEPLESSSATQSSLTPPSTPPTPPELGDDPLGDYFDQLDASFGSGDSPSGNGRSSATDDDDERTDLPTLTSVLGDLSPRPKQRSNGPGGLSLPKEDVLFGAAPVEPPDIRPVPSPSPRGASYRTAEFRSSTRATGREPAMPTLASPAASAQPVGSASSRVDQHRGTVANAFDALMALEEGHAQTAAPVTPPAPAAVTPISDELIDAVAARVIARLAPTGADELVSRIVAEVAERLVGQEIDRIRGRNRM